MAIWVNPERRVHWREWPRTIPHGDWHLGAADCVDARTLLLRERASDKVPSKPQTAGYLVGGIFDIAIEDSSNGDACEYAICITSRVAIRRDRRAPCRLPQVYSKLTQDLQCLTSATESAGARWQGHTAPDGQRWRHRRQGTAQSRAQRIGAHNNVRLVSASQSASPPPVLEFVDGGVATTLPPRGRR